MTEKIELPEEGELVLVKIYKIYPYGAMCHLVEYNNFEAFLPLSEISTRWIKNIREFIHEGQYVVAKVIRVDKRKLEVDISLKDVSERERREKIEAMRREKRAFNLIKFALKEFKLKEDPEQVMETIAEVFDDVASALEELGERGVEYFKKVKLSKKVKEALYEIARKYMKKKKVKARFILKLIVAENAGIFKIKTILKEIEKKGFSVSYIAAGKYMLEVEAEDYKKIKQKKKKLLDFIEKKAKEITGKISISEKEEE